MRIARVFPRKTSASPCDPLAFFGPPGLFPPKVDEVHISVAFTWDIPVAERLCLEWSHIAPVKMDGPALSRGDVFTPGVYLSPGHVITSRGCNWDCWFCKVPRREGTIRELPITDGWIVTDDNLLQCSGVHVRKVMDMLRRQPEPAQFRGGLESASLKEWFAKELKTLRIGRIYFAYDTPDDLPPLRIAGEMLRDHGFTVASHKLMAYVLCGWPEDVCGWRADTMEKAERRMWETVDAGFMPHAMLWRDDSGMFDPDWRNFQRGWNRPAIIGAKIKGR